VSGGNVTLKVEGLKELEKALVEFAEKSPAMIAKAQREPMQKVLADAKALVPKRFGLLRDALQLVTKRASAARASSAVESLSEVGLRIGRPKTGLVGTRGHTMNPRSYWHLVEFGTAHSAPKPFIRPAFDQNTDHLVGQFKSILAEQVERIRARYARRHRRRR
jgi:HK97 gp10 family phage protein